MDLILMEITFKDNALSHVKTEISGCNLSDIMPIAKNKFVQNYMFEKSQHFLES